MKSLCNILCTNVRFHINAINVVQWGEGYETTCTEIILKLDFVSDGKTYMKHFKIAHISITFFETFTNKMSFL